MDANNQPIDSEGTTQTEAQEMLANLLRNGFSDDVGTLSAALGRDEEEIESMLDGETDIDEDLLMKIHGTAQERDIEID